MSNALTSVPLFKFDAAEDRDFFAACWLDETYFRGKLSDIDKAEAAVADATVGCKTYDEADIASFAALEPFWLPADQWWGYILNTRPNSARKVRLGYLRECTCGASPCVGHA